MAEQTSKRAKASRQTVSGRLRTGIFQEAFAKCPFCGLERLGSLQVHHIDDDRANNAPENLIATCGSCHDQITKGFISEADVRMAKQKLQRGVHPFAVGSVPRIEAVNVRDTNNSGIIANRVTIQGKVKAAPIILPTSIGAQPDKYNYVEYLIKRLTHFRESGRSYGQNRSSKVHPGATRKILEAELGGLPKDLPEERFGEVVKCLQEKIDNTAVGRSNRSRGTRNYHSFEEHGQPKN